MRKFKECFTLEKSSSVDYPDFNWKVLEHNDAGSPSVITTYFKTKKEAQKYLSKLRHEMIRLNPLK